MDYEAEGTLDANTLYYRVGLERVCLTSDDYDLVSGLGLRTLRSSTQIISYIRLPACRIAKSQLLSSTIAAICICPIELFGDYNEDFIKAFRVDIMR